MTTTEATIASAELPEWPKILADQAKAVQRMLQQFTHPISASDINTQFKKVQKPATEKREKEISNLLETISELGLLRKTDEGLFVR